MSAPADFPEIEVAAVVIERAGLYLAEYNPGWEVFTLPTARVRRRSGPGGRTPELAAHAALRAAAKALGRPLPPGQFSDPVQMGVPPRVQMRSGRDRQTKRYLYRVFTMRVTDPAPRHAAGWHTVWMKPGDFLTHAPVSLTAVYIVQHLPEDLFVK
jgi:hypothetical protein